MNGEERFLFLGNHLALDFLNTRPVVGGETVEFLEDGHALAGWLGAAGLVSREDARKLAARWRGREIPELLRFREALRQVVLDIEAGGGASPWTGFIALLNRLLEAHPRVNRMIVDPNTEHGLQCVRRFTPRDPQDVFEVVADAAADLLAQTSGRGEAATRLRKCRNCVLHFLDTSKKGSRQWCSMSLCGNRSKVAAFAERKRQEVSGGES